MTGSTGSVRWSATSHSLLHSRVHPTVWVPFRRVSVLTYTFPEPHPRPLSGPTDRVPLAPSSTLHVTTPPHPERPKIGLVSHPSVSELKKISNKADVPPLICPPHKRSLLHPSVPPVHLFGRRELPTCGSKREEEETGVPETHPRVVTFLRRAVPPRSRVTERVSRRGAPVLSTRGRSAGELGDVDLALEGRSRQKTTYKDQRTQKSGKEKEGEKHGQH